MEWYTDKTAYKNIKKLLPNSYLDIKTGKVSDFWIDIDKKSYEENIKIVSELLVDELKAISLRPGEKIQSLTAGYDSRVIYAASKAAGCDFHFFLSTMNKIGKYHPDIKIAKEILNYYDTNLEIIDNLEDFTDDFIDIYKKSLFGAKILPKTLTIFHFYKKDKDYIHISGNNSAVFKSYYKNSYPKNGAELSKLVGIPKNLTIFNDDFDRWLKVKKDFARDKNLDLMKLFYWEMRMPNWGSQYQQEADLAMEEFAPFNNREIILRLLDLSKNKDYKDVFDDIIYYLDPKLLDFPINPRNKKEKLRDMVKNNVSKRSWERIKVVFKK